MVTEVARLLGTGLERINCSKDTTVEQLYGSVMPMYIDNRRKFEWRDGKMLTAMKEEKWILLDEINLLPSDVLESLIPLLDGSAKTDKFAIPGQTDTERISVENVHFFATMNPTAEGGGRAALSRSFKNLFAVISLEAQKNEELFEISKKLFEKLIDSGRIAESHVKKMFDVYASIEQKVESGQIQGAGRHQKFNLRDLSAVRDIVEGNIEAQISHYRLMMLSDGSDEEQSNFDVEPIVVLVMRKALELVFKHRFDNPEAERQVESVIDSVIRAPRGLETDQSSYSIDASVDFLVRIGNIYAEKDASNASSGTLVHTNQTVRQLELLATASQSKRTILLEGTSCSKKTALVKELAALTGSELVVLSLHRDSEVSDLVGQWLPVSLDSIIEQRLRDVIVLKQDVLKRGLEMVDDCDTESRSSFFESMHRVFGNGEPLPSLDAAVKTIADLKKAMEAIPASKSRSCAKLRKKLSSLESLLSEDQFENQTVVFKFVEADLVKALSSGAYVLLDNINAAPPDVLERVLSLFEETPFLNLYEHSEGKVMTVENGEIHEKTRIFATADFKRINTNKLSSPLLNRMIKIWLPEIDSDVVGKSLEEIENHETTEILAQRFGSYAGGGVAASMSVLFHSKIRDLVTNGQITISKENRISFRMLQQAASVANNWLNKGKPMFKANAWGLWRTYASVVERQEDLKKLQSAMQMTCESASNLQPYKFQEILKKRDVSSPCETECSGIQFILASFTQVALKLVLEQILKTRSRCNFKKTMIEFLAFVVKLHPEVEGIQNLLIKDLDNGLKPSEFVSKCDDYGCIFLVECTNKISEIETKRMTVIQNELDSIVELCRQFLSNATFSDWRLRKAFLEDMVAVLQGLIDLMNCRHINAPNPVIDRMEKAAVSLSKVRFLTHYCSVVEDESFNQSMTLLRAWQEASEDVALKFNLTKRFAEPMANSDAKLANSVIRIGRDVDLGKAERNRIALQIYMRSLDWKMTNLIDPRMLLMHKEHISGSSVVEIAHLFSRLKVSKEIHDLVRDLSDKTSTNAETWSETIRNYGRAVYTFATTPFGASSSKSEKSEEIDAVVLATEIQQKFDGILSSSDLAQTLDQDLGKSFDFHRNMFDTLLEIKKQMELKNLYSKIRNSPLRDHFKNYTKETTKSEFGIIWISLFNADVKIATPFDVIKCCQQNLHIDLLKNEEEPTAYLLIGDFQNGRLEDLVSLLVIKKDPSTNSRFVRHYTMNEYESAQDKWLQDWKLRRSADEVIIDKRLLKRNVDCGVVSSRMGIGILACLYTLLVSERGFMKQRTTKTFFDSLKDNMKVYNESLSLVCKNNATSMLDKLLFFDHLLLKLQNGANVKSIRRSIQEITSFFTESRRTLEKQIEEKLTSLNAKISSGNWESAAVSFSFVELMERLKDLPSDDFIHSLRDIERKAKHSFGDLVEALNLLDPILRLKEFLIRFILEAVDIEDPNLWMKSNDVHNFVSNMMPFFLDFLVNENGLKLDKAKSVDGVGQWQETFASLVQELEIPNQLIKENGFDDVFIKWRDEFLPMQIKSDRGRFNQENDASESSDSVGRRKSEKEKLQERFNDIKERYQNLWKDARENQPPMATIMREAVRAVHLIDALKPDQLNQIELAKFQNNLNKLRNDLDKPSQTDGEFGPSADMNECLSLLEDKEKILANSDFSQKDVCDSFQKAHNSEIHFLETKLKEMRKSFMNKYDTSEEIKFIVQLTKTNASASIWDNAIETLRKANACEDISKTQSFLGELAGLGILSDALCTRLAFQSTSSTDCHSLLHAATDELIRLRSEYLLHQFPFVISEWTMAEVPEKLRRIDELLSEDKCNMMSAHPIVESLQTQRTTLLSCLNDHSTRYTLPLTIGCPSLKLEDIMVLFSDTPETAHRFLIKSTPANVFSSSLPEIKQGGWMTSYSYGTSDDERIQIFQTGLQDVKAYLDSLVKIDQDESGSKEDNPVILPSGSEKEIFYSLSFVFIPLLLARSGFDHVSDYVKLSETEECQKKISDALQSMKSLKFEIEKATKILKSMEEENTLAFSVYPGQSKTHLRKNLNSMQKKLDSAESEHEHLMKIASERKPLICTEISESCSYLMMAGFHCFGDLLNMSGERTEQMLEEALQTEDPWHQIFLEIRGLSMGLSRRSDFQTTIEKWWHLKKKFFDEKMCSLASDDSLRRAIDALCTISLLGNLSMAHFLTKKTNFDDNDAETSKKLCSKIRDKSCALVQLCKNGCLDPKTFEAIGEDLLSLQDEIRLTVFDAPEASNYLHHLLLDSIGTCYAFADSTYPISWYRDILLPKLEDAVKDGSMLSLPTSDNKTLKADLDRIPCRWESCITSFNHVDDRCSTNPFQLAWKMERRIRINQDSYQSVSFLGRHFLEGIIELCNKVHSLGHGFDKTEVSHLTKIVERTSNLLLIDFKNLQLQSVQNEFDAIELALRSLNEIMIQQRKDPTPFVSHYLQNLCSEWLVKSIICCMKGLRDEPSRMDFESLQNRIADFVEGETSGGGAGSMLILADFKNPTNLKSTLAENNLSSQLSLTPSELDFLSIIENFISQIPQDVQHVLLRRWKEFKAFKSSWNLIKGFENFLDSHHELMKTNAEIVLKHGIITNSQSQDALNAACGLMQYVGYIITEEIKNSVFRQNSDFKDVSQKVSVILGQCKSVYDDYEGHLKTFADGLEFTRQTNQNGIVQWLKNLFQKREQLDPSLCELVSKLCSLYAQIWTSIGTLAASHDPSQFWDIFASCDILKFNHDLCNVLRNQETLLSKKLVSKNVSISSFNLRFGIVFFDFALTNDGQFFTKFPHGIIWLSCDGHKQPVYDANSYRNRHPERIIVKDPNNFEFKVIATSETYQLDMTLGLNDLNSRPNHCLKIPVTDASTLKMEMVLEFESKTYSMISLSPMSGNHFTMMDFNVDRHRQLENAFRSSVGEYLKRSEELVKSQEDEKAAKAQQKDIAKTDLSRDLASLHSSKTSKTVCKAMTILGQLQKAIETAEISLGESISRPFQLQHISTLMKATDELFLSTKALNDLDMTTFDMTVVDSDARNPNLTKSWNPGMRQSFFELKSFISEIEILGSEALKALISLSKDFINLTGLRCYSDKTLSELKRNQDKWPLLVKSLNLELTWKEVQINRSNPSFEAVQTLAKKHLQWIQAFDKLSDRASKVEAIPKDAVSLVGTSLSHLAKIIISQQDDGRLSLSDGSLGVDFGTLLHESDHPSGANGRQVYPIEVMNQSTTSMIVTVFPEEKESNFSVLPPKTIRLCAKTTHCFRFTIDPSVSGPLKEQWRIGSDDGNLNESFSLQANIQRLAVQFSTEIVDFGVLLPKSKIQTRSVIIRNVTDLPILVKNQIQEGTSRSELAILHQKFILPPREERPIEITLKPDTKEECVEKQIVIGVVQKYKQLTIKASVKSPKYELKEKTGKKIIRSFDLPSTRNGMASRTTIQLTNSGEVPICFKISPDDNLKISPCSGKVAIGQSSSVKLKMDYKDSSEARSQFKFFVKGCDSQIITVHGKWSNPTPSFQTCLVTFKIDMESLLFAQREGQNFLTLQASNTLENRSDVPVAVSPPNSEYFRFDRDKFVVEAKQKLEFKMFWDVEKLDIRKHKVTFATDSNHQISFEIQMKVPDPDTFMINYQSPIFNKTLKPGTSDVAFFCIKSKSKFAIETDDPQCPQIESLTLKTNQRTSNGKGPWNFGSQDIPEVFDFSSNDSKFNVTLKVKDPSGWIIENIYVKAEGSILVQDDLLKCTPLDHCVALVAYVSDKPHTFNQMFAKVKGVSKKETRPNTTILASVPDLSILRHLIMHPGPNATLGLLLHEVAILRPSRSVESSVVQSLLEVEQTDAVTLMIDELMRLTSITASSLRESLKDYVEDVLQHCDDVSQSRLIDVVIPSVALDNTSKHSVHIASALYILLHADCSEQYRWKAAVAYMKNLMSHSNDAAFFGMACETVWGISNSDLDSIHENIDSVRNIICQSDRELLDGLHLLEVIFTSLDDTDKAALLDDEIQKLLSESQPSLSKQDINQIVTSLEERDDRKLLTQMIEPKIKKCIQQLGSSNRHNFMESLKNLEKTTGAKLQDKLAFHLLSIVCQRADTNYRYNSFDPEMKAKGFISKIFDAYGSSFPCDSICNLCKKGQEKKWKLHHIKSVVVETLFHILPNFVSVNGHKAAQVKEIFKNASQKVTTKFRRDISFDSFMKERSIESQMNLDKMVKRWIDADPTNDSISVVIDPLVEAIAILFPSDPLGSSSSTDDHDKMKDLVKEAMTFLDPKTINDSLPPMQLVSKVLRFCSTLTGDESFIDVTDGIMAWNDNRPKESFDNFCTALASATSDSRLERILNTLMNSGESKDLETDLLYAALPEESLEALLSIIDSWFHENSVLDTDCKQKAKRICPENTLKMFSDLASLSKARRRLEEFDFDERLSIEFLLAVKAFVDLIQIHGKWSEKKKRSFHVLDVFFSLAAIRLVDSKNEEAYAFCKMCLLISLVNFCKTQCWKEREKMLLSEETILRFSHAIPPSIPVHEDPDTDEDSESVTSSESDKNEKSSLNSDLNWVWLMDKIDVTEEQIYPSTQKSDESDDEEQISLSFEAADPSDIIPDDFSTRVIEEIRNRLETVENLIDGDAFLKMVGNDDPVEAFNFKRTVDIVFNLKETGDAWTDAFEKIVRAANRPGRTNQKNGECDIVRFGIKIVSLIDFVTQYLKVVSAFTVPEELTKTGDVILQNLKAIPKGNISEDMKDLLEESGAQINIKSLTTENFPMPSKIANLNQSCSQPHFDPAFGRNTFGQWSSSANFNLTETRHSLSTTNSVKKVQDAVYEHEKKMQLQQRIITKRKINVTMAIGAKPIFEAGPSQSQSPQEEKIESQGTLIIPKELKFQGHQSSTSNVLHRAPEQTMDASQLRNILMGAPEDENMITAVIELKEDVGVTKQQLREQDLSKFYKNTAVANAEVKTHKVKDPVNVEPILHDRWTYDLLVGSVPFTKFLTEVMHTFESYFEKFYSSVNSKHVIEWCIMVDNSGSMLIKETQTMEALVLAMEALTRLECPFAVARFGDRNSQQILKSMKEPCTPIVGQRVLESFSFDQGTYPATGLLNIAEKVWPHGLSEEDSKQHHRVMLMIVDGLTQERNPEDYTRVRDNKNFDLVVLNLEDDKQADVRGQIEALWKATSTCYDVLNVKSIDDLPKILASLMKQQMDNMFEQVKRLSETVSLQQLVQVYDVFTETIAEAKFMDVLSNLGRQTLPSVLEAYKKDSFFACGFSHDSVPYFLLTEGMGLKEIDACGYDIESLLEKAHQRRSHLQSDPNKGPLLKVAGVAWTQAENRMSHQISRMAEALQAYLPENVYTRKRADVRGPSIHLQGFIKHLATQGNEQKIFANKKGGGKSEYSVVILLDVSASMMNGRKQICALETVFLLIEALRQMNIQNFSAVLFGGAIYPVKLADMEWEDASIAALISLSTCVHEPATMDADALLFAAELLDASNGRGPKKVFMVTDGYGSTGVKLAAALTKLDELGIDVLAMGIGPEAFFVPHCYNKWITAALPQMIPDALERLEDQIQSQARKQAVNQKDPIDWLRLALLPEGAAESVEEVLLNKTRAFPNLLEAMKTEREVKLKAGNKPTSFTIDICFVVDFTGSMSPWISAVKSLIKVSFIVSILR